jgi:hypothetical protein
MRRRRPSCCFQDFSENLWRNRARGIFPNAAPLFNRVCCTGHGNRLFSFLLTHFSLCQHHVRVQALLNSQQVKNAYLAPNRGSLQKPIEGLPEKIEDRSAIGAETAQNHVKNYIKGGYSLFRAYQYHTLKPQIFIQNYRFKMEKPAETWLKLYVVDLGFVSI